jgi:Flp pilus assembly protein TadB
MSNLFRADGVCKFLVFLVFFAVHNVFKLFLLGYCLELWAYLLSALRQRVEKEQDSFGNVLRDFLNVKETENQG